MSRIDSPGITPSCLYPEPRYFPSTRQAEAIRAVIKSTEHDLDHEYKAFEEQLSGAREKSSPEVLRLKQELNKIRANIGRKKKELDRLRETAEYPPLPNLFSLEEIAESPPLSSLEPLSEQLQSSLQIVSDRIVREEQTTEMLKQMLEKVRKAEMIMKQRTREVMSVWERVTHQLIDVKRMKHIAENYFTLTSNEKTRLKEEMDQARNNFRSHFETKSERLTLMSNSSRRLIERIGTQIFTHTEVSKKKAAIMESLESEVKRHSGDRVVVKKAEEDLQAFRGAFRVIQRVMKNAGCEMCCDKGISPESVRLIIHQFNIMLVFEGSLASRYNGLTWEYSEKETHLAALRRDYESLLRLLPTAESSEKIRYSGLFDGSQSADSLEQTSLDLYTGLLSLLHLLQTVHARVAECVPTVSPSLATWSVLKTVTKGFRLKKKENTISSSAANDCALLARHRHMTSLPVRSRTEKSEDLDQLSREVLHRDVSQYQPLSPAEVSKAISGSPLSSVEKAGILTAFSKLLVVKFFADASMLKDVLKSGNFRGKVLEALIEKANAAMRTGFKELISYAKDAISSFAKEEEEGKEIVSGYNRRRSLNAWVGSETKQEGEIEERAEVEKELARERFAALCPQATDSSTETDSRKVGDPSSSKRPSVLDAPPGHTPVPPPLDLEALEARYIRSTRLQLRSSSSQQPPVPPPKRLISSSASVGRLRRLQDRDINPSAERAKSLLKDFLDTERKIMVVRCAERVTLKSHSARNTPTVKRYHRFQVGSPLKAKPSKLEVRKRLMRSHTMLGGERFGRLAGL